MANLRGAVTALSGYNIPGGQVGLDPFIRWDSVAQGDLESFQREAAAQQARANQLLGGPDVQPISTLPARVYDNSLVASQPRGLGSAAVPGEIDQWSLQQQDMMRIREMGTNPYAVPSRRAVATLRRDVVRSLSRGGLTPTQVAGAHRIIQGSDDDVLHIIRGGLVGRNTAQSAARRAGVAAPESVQQAALGAQTVASAGKAAARLGGLFGTAAGGTGAVRSTYQSSAAARQDRALQFLHNPDAANADLAARRDAARELNDILFR